MTSGFSQHFYPISDLTGYLAGAKTMPENGLAPSKVPGPSRDGVFGMHAIL